jgi:hypothetical protein
MDPMLAMPIPPDWICIEPATAGQLAVRLGSFDVAALDEWRLAIAAAGWELAAAAGRSWPFDGNPPLVPMLRALGRLAEAAPDVASAAAGALLAAMAVR